MFSGTVRTSCTVVPSSKRCCALRVGQRIAADLAPPEPEVRADVGDDRAFEPEARVVPAEPVARRMDAVIESLPAERRQVDAADERNAVVDDHELLVVAVHGALLRVERHRDSRPGDELVAHLPYLAAVGMEERQRRARPREDPHVDALGRIGEQRAQPGPACAHAEVGREEPAGELHVPLRRRDLLGDAGKRVRRRRRAARRGRLRPARTTPVSAQPGVPSPAGVGSNARA